MLTDKIEKIITEEIKNYVFSYNENEENIEKIPDSFVENFKKMSTKKTKKKVVEDSERCSHEKKDGERCSYKIHQDGVCKIHSKSKEKLKETPEDDSEKVKRTCKYIFPKKGSFCQKSPKKGELYCSSHIKNKNAIIAKKAQLIADDSNIIEENQVYPEEKEIDIQKLKNIEVGSEDEYPIDYTINNDTENESVDVEEEDD